MIGSWSHCGRAAAIALVFLLGCVRGPDCVELAQACNDLRGNSNFPADAESATKLRATQGPWGDKQARRYYACEAVAIGARDVKWRAEERSAEERAHLAYETRRNARLITRVMMANRSSVEGLRERDREKYGNPDGPSFEYLMERARKNGLRGDEPFESIVRSAQRTDPERDRQFGLCRD